MRLIHIGSRVRIAGGSALRAESDLPEPGQMLWAGREADVIGYRYGARGHPLYALRGAPGLWWREEWLDPV